MILAHVGSTHTDAELSVLLEQARQMVVGGHAALDFEVAARAQSMADVPDFRLQALIAERAISIKLDPASTGMPSPPNALTIPLTVAD